MVHYKRLMDHLFFRYSIDIEVLVYIDTVEKQKK